MKKMRTRRKAVSGKTRRKNNGEALSVYLEVRLLDRTINVSLSTSRRKAWGGESVHPCGDVKKQR